MGGSLAGRWSAQSGGRMGARRRQLGEHAMKDPVIGFPMQNDLLEPPLSQGVMQHVTLPPQPMSGPLSQAPAPSVSESEQPDPNRARKVAEVFLTAGHAFQKLGDLAMQLHMGPSSVPSEERWSENNVDHLREALTRFAHELDQISNNVQARTTKMISTDIRRRHMTPQRPVASAISTLKASTCQAWSCNCAETIERYKEYSKVST
ncbi:hypothetical protein OSTOST_07833 [Ostertagia ostertagi]